MRVAAIQMIVVCAGLAAVFGNGAVASPADVTVTFEESAPTDVFRIANTSRCNATITDITINLVGSAGGLVFDTAAGGAGVDVYQPFGVRSGEALITRATPVGDGDRQVTLTFSALVPGSAVEFTIDVDDRLLSSAFGQSRVSGSEISGAEITATMVWPSSGQETVSGTFGPDAVARITARSCTTS